MNGEQYYNGNSINTIFPIILIVLHFEMQLKSFSDFFGVMSGLKGFEILLFSNMCSYV